MNRIALLIPARNAERFLPRLFKSAAAAGGFDEVLLYDDASTDATADVAQRLGATVVPSDVNTGPSAGKNVLARRATSEWVHFHDADEALAPTFVARARQWVEDPDVDVVLFGTEDRDDASGATLGTNRWDDAAVAADAVRFNIQHTVTNCGLYRRSAFLAAGGFDEDSATQYNEDQAMHLRLALAGLRFRADSDVGVIVYRRSHSMSSGHPIECVQAQIEVLARTATRTGTRYREEIGARLWRLAGVSGGFKDWTSVDRCIALACDLGYTDPRNEHWIMRAAATFDARTAIRVREAVIRWLKPSERSGVPVVAGGEGRKR